MKNASHPHRLLLTTAIALALPSLASALPTGGTVSVGNATISSSSTQTTVNQTTSKALIDWTGFNTTKGQTVQFNDPNSSAITLNRISGSATSFDGALKSNGNVWLINTNGILIGSSGTVNTNGFLATTSNISNSNFAAGNYSFTPGGGNATATVSNAGNITVAKAGLAALVAPNVTNSGTITAKAGKITLASGDTYAVDLAGDGLINLAASKAMKSQSLSNSGTLNATGGSVVITAAQASGLLDHSINVDGLIEANSLSASNQSGDLNYGAKFTGSTGGSVTLAAYRNVTVDSNVQIAPTSGKLNVTLDSNDTGAAGGGAIYMATGSGIISNGGNIVLGGGTNPVTGYAVGDSVTTPDQNGNLIYNNGIYLNDNTQLFAAGGNITLNGKGAVSDDYYLGSGVYMSENSASAYHNIETNGTGTININGDAASGLSPFSSTGVLIYNATISTDAGGLNIYGNSGKGLSLIGTDIQNSLLNSNAGYININGYASGTVPVNPYYTQSNTSFGLYVNNSVISSGSGNIYLNGSSGYNVPPTTVAAEENIGALIQGVALYTQSGGIYANGFAGAANAEQGLAVWDTNISSGSATNGIVSLTGVTAKYSGAQAVQSLSMGNGSILSNGGSIFLQGYNGGQTAGSLNQAVYLDNETVQSIKGPVYVSGENFDLINNSTLTGGSGVYFIYEN